MTATVLFFLRLALGFRIGQLVYRHGQKAGWSIRKGFFVAIAYSVGASVLIDSALFLSRAL